VFGNAWAWEHYNVLALQPMFVLAAHFRDGLRSRWRAWLDELGSWQALVREALIVALGVGGLALVFTLFGFHVGAADSMLELWRKHRDPWYDREMHLFDIANWAPWPILILMCLFAVRYYAPRRRLATADARPKSAQSGASAAIPVALSQPDSSP